MRRTRIKICGVRDVPTALVAAECGADAIGLAFVKGSPREVGVEQACRIVDALPAFVEPVALFVDAPCERVRDIAGQVGIGTIQLHGSEGPDQVAQLSPLHVIKAMAFDSGDISNRLSVWRDCVGRLVALLWDAAPPDDESEPGLPGGTGRTFDWNALAVLGRSDALAGMPPTILAGGLSPHNVGRAIATVRPYAVDVSSGIESSSGVKDANLIRAFVQAVREADEQTSDAGSNQADD